MIRMGRQYKAHPLDLQTLFVQMLYNRLIVRCIRILVVDKTHYYIHTFHMFDKDCNQLNLQLYQNL